MKQRHSEYDGNEIRGFTSADGAHMTADDEWIEDLASQWEHDGVDGDLVYMARGLLNGSDRQQAMANKFLSRVRDTHMKSDEAQMHLIALVGREGVGMGRVPHMSEAEFNAAWDDFSGAAQRPGLGNVSFGHSDKTRKEHLSDGVDPQT